MKSRNVDNLTRRELLARAAPTAALVGITATPAALAYQGGAGGDPASPASRPSDGRRVALLAAIRRYRRLADADNAARDGYYRACAAVEAGSIAAEAALAHYDRECFRLAPEYRAARADLIAAVLACHHPADAFSWGKVQVAVGDDAFVWGDVANALEVALGVA